MAHCRRDYLQAPGPGTSSPLKKASSFRDNLLKAVRLRRTTPPREGAITRCLEKRKSVSLDDALFRKQRSESLLERHLTWRRSGRATRRKEPAGGAVVIGGTVSVSDVEIQKLDRDQLTEYERLMQELRLRQRRRRDVDNDEYASLAQLNDEKAALRLAPFPIEPAIELRHHQNETISRRPSARSRTLHEYAFSNVPKLQLAEPEEFVNACTVPIYLRGITKVTMEGTTRKLTRHQCLRILNDRLSVTSNEDDTAEDVPLIECLMSTDYKAVSKKELVINKILNETSTKLLCKLQFDNTKDMNLAIVDLESYYGSDRSPCRSVGLLSGVTGEEKSQIRYKLLKLLGKRSSKDMLEKKGIIKNEPIFGNTLRHLYEMYKQEVPEFVIRIVQLIELPKNIISLGLYRASGNLATIQKIRYHIDKNNLKILEEFQNESDVLTGSLKLFFRELKEPLIPHRTYQELCKYIDTEVSHKTEDKVRQAVEKMDGPHKKTLLTLLNHLLKVESQSEENKMDAYNISIVWGPTLIWLPDNCQENIITNHHNANKIVELLIRVYKNSSVVSSPLKLPESKEEHRKEEDNRENTLNRNALITELTENLTNSLKKGSSRDNLMKSWDSLGKLNEVPKTPDNDKKIDLEVLCANTKEKIPEFVLKVVPSIEREVDAEYLYRKAGSNERLDKIWKKIVKNKSRFNSLEKYNVHDLTFALKTFFSRTKTLLIPRDIFERLIFATEERIEITKLRNTKKEYVKSNLPFRETLNCLLRHLVIVSQHEEHNKMSKHNLATEWAPVLCGSFISSHEFSPGSCVHVIETLLQIHDSRSAINVDTDSFSRNYQEGAELPSSPLGRSPDKSMTPIQVLPRSRKGPPPKNDSSLYRVSRFLNNTLSMYDNVPYENVRNEATFLESNRESIEKAMEEDRTKL